MNVHKTTGRWKYGAGLAFFTAFMWAVAPVALKLVLEDMDAYTVAWYRFLLSAAILTAWVKKKYGFSVFTKLDGKTRLFLVVPVIALTVNYALFMLGLDRIPPSSAVVIVQLAPMFLLFGGLLVFKERYSPRQFVGFAVLVSGLVLFFNQRIGTIVSGAGGSYTIGILLVIAAALVWAVYALSQKQLLNSLPSEAIMLAVYAGGAVLFIPFASAGELFKLDHLRIGLLIFMGLNTVFAYGTFSESLDHLEASRVSAVLATIPLMALGIIKLIVWFVPDFAHVEQLNWLSYVGALMVVAGSMTSSLSKPPDPGPHCP